MNTLLAFATFVLPHDPSVALQGTQHHVAGGGSTFNRLTPGAGLGGASEAPVRTWRVEQRAAMPMEADFSIEERVRKLLADGRVGQARALAKTSENLPTSLQRALKPPVASTRKSDTNGEVDLRGAVALARSFPGQWVAVVNSSVVAHEQDPAVLREYLDEKRLHHGVFILKVPLAAG